MTDIALERENAGDPAGSLYERGCVHMASARLEEAVHSFEQSIAIYPHFKCLELMGECLLELGRPIAAVVPLAAASRLNAQVRAPSLLARAFLEIGEFDRALELAEEVLGRAPGNRVAKQVLGHPSVQEALAARLTDGAA